VTGKTDTDGARGQSAGAVREQLDELYADTQDRFNHPAAAGRLAQLRAALDTAAMAVDHLHDEHGRREADKAERVRRAEAGE
jgi:hypothetical protein